MCLAIPVRIDRIHNSQTGVAVVGGIQREVDISLVDDLTVGDYVILHVGYALSKIDPEEAEETLRSMSDADMPEILQ